MVAWSRDFISLMKSLVEDLPHFWRKQAVLTVEISSLFLWKFQNKGQWITLGSYWLSDFTSGHRHSHIHQWGSHPERMYCRSHFFIHFSGDSSSFSFFSSFCWLISLVRSSTHSLESCFPWLSNISVHSSPVTLSNPASCASLLMSSTMSFNGSNPVKSCINPGRSLHHTPFKQLTDTSSQAALLLLIPVKMSNECSDRYVWPVQNSHHFHEGLAEVIDFKGC